MQCNVRGETAQARTYQDLLKDEHDEALFDYYGTAGEGVWRDAHRVHIMRAMLPSPALLLLSFRQLSLNHSHSHPLPIMLSPQSWCQCAFPS